MAICYDGVKIDRAARNVGNFFDWLVIFCPADNCLFSTYGNEQCRTIKIFTDERAFRHQRFSSNDAGVRTLAVHEVDIAHRNKLGVEVYVSAILCDSDCGSETSELVFILIEPTSELIAFLLRSSRNSERFIVLNLLFINYLIAIVKRIDDTLCIRGENTRGGGRVFRQYVQRQ